MFFQDQEKVDYFMAEWTAKLLQTVDTELRYRYSKDENGEYDPANILYGMEVSQEHLDQALEYFEGRAIVIPDFDEEDPGAEHPLYVKNKDEVLESWKMKVTDAEFSSANE